MTSLDAVSVWVHSCTDARGQRFLHNLRGVQDEAAE